jgi:hypothetical protein
MNSESWAVLPFDQGILVLSYQHKITAFIAHVLDLPIKRTGGRIVLHGHAYVVKQILGGQVFILIFS